MQSHHAFDVAGSADAAFAALRDLDRVVSCLPGVALAGSDDGGVHGRLAIRVAGDVLTYEGDLDIEVADPDRRETRVVARGVEVDGHGNGRAILVGTVTPLDAERCRVDITTDLDVERSGSASSIGQAAVNEVARRLLDQFSRNLEALIGSEVSRAPRDTAVADEPVDPDVEQRAVGDDDQRRARAWIPITGATVVAIGVIGLIVTWWMRCRSRAFGASP